MRTCAVRKRGIATAAAGRLLFHSKVLTLLTHGASIRTPRPQTLHTWSLGYTSEEDEVYPSGTHRLPFGLAMSTGARGRRGFILGRSRTIASLDRTAESVRNDKLERSAFMNGIRRCVAMYTRVKTMRTTAHTRTMNKRCRERLTAALDGVWLGQRAARD
jgi:hypothetical protein